MTHRPKTLSELSPGMQRGLIRCSTLIVEVLDPKHCGIAPATIRALQRRDLISVQVDSRLRRVYRPTASGAALISADEPLFLHRRAHRSYTTREAEALRAEQVVDATGARRSVPVEAVSPAVLDEYAKQARARDAARAAGVDDDLLSEQRDLEERLRRMRQLAAERGVSANGDLRVAQRAIDQAHKRLDAVESRIRAQTGNRAA